MGELATGCVWCVEVPDPGEEVVENGDEGSTTVLKEVERDTGRSGGFVFEGGTGRRRG